MNQWKMKEFHSLSAHRENIKLNYVLTKIDQSNIKCVENWKKRKGRKRARVQMRDRETEREREGEWIGKWRW